MHFKDVETLVGFAQNKIISHIIQEAWFKKITSDGVVYSKYFDPISLETMALVFAVVSCLSWHRLIHITNPHYTID
jgi:hypothetical protein